MYENWKSSDSIIEEYEKSGLYMSIELGMRTIDPKSIIALSRIPVESKLVSLRNKVNKHGWKDPTPQGLHLVLLPDTEHHVVCSGGNHRAVISNELKIEKIQASVSAYLNINLMSEDELLYIEEKEKEIGRMFVQIRLEKAEFEINNLHARLMDLENGVDEFKKNLYFKYFQKQDGLK
ncbi:MULTISPECIES: hypothetical protein [Paenibacillus]|uniref:hypothetical protein n=1 Tax=Paenibacillus TaxID=44249 RepID=UPI000466E791|nr:MULTISPECIES: hypothetical protein [Paenibacillus]KGP77418.1 hypothetical protein P364_0133175 [Paenibacillus sp. MAEPY2]KGP79377.1 hypothetical protein P363_0131165 [Paenibacillus sp. MAEPY1]OZQ60176.1 hypothetical protein CA599_30790 [Paenibacillus taichungensis]